MSLNYYERLKVVALVTIILAALGAMYLMFRMAGNLAPARPPAPAAPPVIMAPPAPTVATLPARPDAAPAPDAAPRVTARSDAAPIALAPKPKAKPRPPSSALGVAFYCRNFTAKTATAAMCWATERNCVQRSKLGALPASSQCFPSRYAHCFAWEHTDGRPDMTCATSEIDCRVWANINPANTTDCYLMSPQKYLQVAAKLLE